MGKLIIVPTPIGNLEDITLRAIRILDECDLIFSEDTRVTKKLLSHLNISKPILSYHANNEHRILDRVLERIIANQTTVLVSDAGTPGISDPGFLLIRACIQNEIEVECLPGATALIPALVGSGFPVESFYFHGFLPHKKGRLTILKQLSNENKTIVLYESPHRLVKLLQQMTTYFSTDRNICVVRELSKKFETYHRGTLGDLINYFEQNSVKGEIVVVIEGNKFNS